MKTLDNDAAKHEIMERLRNVRPDSIRRWGRMTCQQMICHLSDSMKGVIGEKTISARDNLFTRSVMKWVALRAPTPWPHGVKTMPEMDQLIGGSRPTEFESDRQELISLLERVTCKDRDFAWLHHPIFGRMSEWEWQRWAYLHADHHLRQFGA